MSRVRRSVATWARDTSEQLSLWQTIVLFLLSACVLFVKMKDFVVAIWSKLAEEFENFFHAFASLQEVEEDPTLGFSAELSPRAPPAHGTASSSYVVTPPASPTGELLPMLLDSITRGVLWDKLCLPRSISLLYRLRRVNRAWRDFVGTTIEWTALEVTRLDNPGYERFARKWRGSHKRRTRFERYNIEIGNLNVLLSETQRSISGLVWRTQAPPVAADPGLDYYAEVALGVM